MSTCPEPGEYFVSSNDKPGLARTSSSECETGLEAQLTSAHGIRTLSGSLLQETDCRARWPEDPFSSVSSTPFEERAPSILYIIRPSAHHEGGNPWFSISRKSASSLGLYTKTINRNIQYDPNGIRNIPRRDDLDQGTESSGSRGPRVSLLQ